VLLQGIDPSLFHPAPRRGLVNERFVVFSGGKLEYRKGQDLAVLAFSRFARRHPDALLLMAWGSPWPGIARNLAGRSAAAEVPFDAEGRPDHAAWTEANGIPPSQVRHLPPLPSVAMPRLLREADVALFPNRAEGGTNLVAMECMACGIPTILSANTGHLDLVQDDTCLPLLQQAPIPGPSYRG